MKNFCAGDMVKLKVNSKLNKRYFFSKKTYESFIVLAISVSNRTGENNVEVVYSLKLISFIDFLKFRKSLINYINITGLTSYNSKNFYKIDRRLILEKKEETFISKIMSR